MYVVILVMHVFDISPETGDKGNRWSMVTYRIGACMHVQVCICIGDVQPINIGGFCYSQLLPSSHVAKQRLRL